MSEHEQKADQAERDLQELEQRSEHLQEEIEGASEDWESKKKDPGVPGATGELDEDGDESGGDDVSADQLDFGREVEREDIVGEAPSDDEDAADDDEDDSDDDADEDDSDDDAEEDR